jgi:hypothetical protein
LDYYNHYNSWLPVMKPYGWRTRGAAERRRMVSYRYGVIISDSLTCFLCPLALLFFLMQSLILLLGSEGPSSEISVD